MANKNTVAQDIILEHLGTDKWENVQEVFGGMSHTEIEHMLDATFINEDNTVLARMIANSVK
ncbi:MAG: hypothetical protein IPN27_11580 [Cellvibrionales bacterium]|nr:hypothetical protein [Cellvibrionales bacterium]